MFTIVNISIFCYFKKEAIVNDFNKHTMYTEHLPESLPENWIIAELDEDYEYLEFLGFDGEFLISIMPHPEENPSLPYFLTLSQLKGILGRYDFDNLVWPVWHGNPAEAVRSAVELMEWINRNYGSFIPLATEVFLSVGTVDQLDQLRGYFRDELVVHDFEGQQLVFRKAKLLRGAEDYAASAIETIYRYAESCNVAVDEIKGGLLTNERFQLIEDLRPVIKERLRLIQRVG
jgi:hypothetical protein